MSLTVGSLFSGIGGIDLGLERAGFRIAWQCEIDAYCQKVLAKHWPHVARYGDIRTVGKHNLQAVDLLCGGFPCQDISNAGKRAGITGERSGLWSEFYRVICELRPSFVLVENVADLLKRGFGRVLGDLAASGYDAEWQCIPASAIGAPHKRDRIFIVAYAHSIRCNDRGDHRQGGYVQADGQRYTQKIHQNGEELQFEPGSYGSYVPYPNRERLEIGSCFGSYARQELASTKRSHSTRNGQWAFEPGMVRVVDGISDRMDRIRGLGNAVVPQIVTYIGECILAALNEQEQAS